MARFTRKKVFNWLSLLMPGYPDEGRRIVQGSRLQRFLERAAASPLALRRVFNAGAGEGGFTPLLLGLPGVSTVFESDFGYRAQLPSRINARQIFFGASLASIPLADATVDLILCTEVLEHIVEHESALDELTRVLTSGGWLIITVPTPPAPPDAAHVREGYRPEELSAMIERRGFQIHEIQFCMYFFFRFLLTHWSRFPFWCPRIVIRGLAHLDRWIPIGPPMDLMILAQLSGKRSSGAVSSPAGAERAGSRPAAPGAAPMTGQSKAAHRDRTGSEVPGPRKHCA
jgi:SAM-dependent methyltransferase